MASMGSNVAVDGEKILNKIQECGFYGVRDFTHKHNFSYQTLYMITKGNQNVIRSETLIKLASVLKVVPSDLTLMSKKAVEKEKPFNELKRVAKEYEWEKEIDMRPEKEENKELKNKTTFNDLMVAVESIENHKENFELELKVNVLEKEIYKLKEEFRKSQVIEQKDDRLKEENSRLKEENEKLRIKERFYNQNVEKELIKKVKRIVERSGFKCNSIKAIEKYLGCTIKDFRKYIEELFEDGMTWENHGKNFEEWQFDHIKQFITFNLKDEKEKLASCNYSNLRPLWSDDNYKRPKLRYSTDYIK